MDFKTYKKSAKDDEKTKEIEREIERLGDKSESELKEEFFARYEEEREKGNIDEKRLDEMADVIKGFVGNEQKLKLDKILSELKGKGC